MDPLLEIFERLPGPIDLPQARYPRPNRQAGVTPVRTEGVFRFGRWARPDNGHLAPQDVNKLGKFIDAGITQKLTYRRYPRVVLHLELWAVCLIHSTQFVLYFVGADTHSAELQAIEVFAVQPLPSIAEENRSRRCQLDHQGDNRQ